ncbi:KilA-N domain-containing protein [Francisella marina]|uniref:KilA-N domain-containing protein n=1 Tax=Francisella marina TaxID=2249302 RepID=UPI0011EC456D|nr:KilA-N domain-containing protein [Francisella marina]QEO58315.1 KilA-N domain-containing protein [Francisella marina]
MSNLIIANQEVKQVNGLYCLNDFHKAGGGSNQHRPSIFMSNKQTKELINEIEAEAGIIASRTVKGGDITKQGTYACKELVYAYAMWISPKFHLFVIRTFDNLVSEQMKEAEQELFHKERTIKSMSVRWANDREELREFKEYHHQEISKWQYEVEQMRKGNQSKFEMKDTKYIEKYTIGYLASGKTNLDNLLKAMQCYGVEVRDFVRDWKSAIIFLNILRDKNRLLHNRAQMLIHEYEETTPTIYSHELVGLC